MFRYIKNIFGNIFLLVILGGASFVNWQWPFYKYLTDSTIYRLLWLAVFFIILDIGLEAIAKSVQNVKLISGILAVEKKLKNMKGYKIIPKVHLPNNIILDYAVIGSSGVWVVALRDRPGKVIFNGDDLVQAEVILKGLLSRSLQSSFSLAEILNQKLNRPFTVTPIIVFSGLNKKIDTIPPQIRNVFVASRHDIDMIIQDTERQILDTKSIEKVASLLE